MYPETFVAARDLAVREVLVGAGSSLVATVIGYVFLDVLFEGWGIGPKVVGALALGSAALALALWASRQGRENPPGAVRLASDISGSSVVIDEVRAKVNPDQEVTVGSNLQVNGPVTITRTTIDSTRGRRE